MVLVTFNPQHTDQPAILVAAQDLRCGVARTMVGHDRELDPLGEVVVEVGLEDLPLVADDEGHDQPHRVGVGGTTAGKRACISDQAVVTSVWVQASIEWSALR